MRADGSSSGLPGKDLELLKRQAKEFVELLKDTTLSMAELQGFLMNHKSDPGRALRSCPSLVAKALQGRHPLKKAGQGNKSSDLEL